MEPDRIAAGRRSVLENFRWMDGEADTWSMLRPGDSLSAIVGGLAELVRDERADVVLGIEARGFVLGPAVAVALGIGFLPVRKEGALFPGPTLSAESTTDYRGNRHRLRVRADHLAAGQRVVLVDDWIETGSQASAAQQVVAQAGAMLVSIAVIVDEASEETKLGLPPVRALVTSEELRDE